MKKMKNLISVICLSLLFVFSVGVLAKMATPTPAYAAQLQPDGGSATPKTGTTASDLVDKGVEGLNSTTAALVKICLALFPIALLVCIAAILITHDYRKISGLIGTCITIIVATLAVMLINAGTLLKILEDIAEYFK